MEPTLFPGDILVIRKADGLWQRWKFPSRRIEGNEEKNHSGRFNEADERAFERERVLAYEREHCNSNGSIGLFRKPPTPITGDVAVFKDPGTYPDRWNIKRVVAIGGETVVKPPANSNTVRHGDVNERFRKEDVLSSSKKETKAGSIAYVPPYCIWVEGDNQSNLKDISSRSNGPVSKKLLVGIAEYRLWPPWRVGKLDNERLSHNM